MKNIPYSLLFLLSFCCSGQSISKWNLDFEQRGVEHNLSKDWFIWGNGKVELDSIDKHRGSFSAKVSSGEEKGIFGSVAYKIPAKYSGKEIRLEGFMKTEDVSDGFAGLLLRVDKNGQSAVFENMQKEQILGTNNWKKYVITLKYPEDADVIYVGGLLAGNGKAWFDDFELRIDGKSIQKLEEVARELKPAEKDKEFDKGSNVSFGTLDSKSIQNLTILGKVWGFMKYHHPAVGKGLYNLDYELFRFLPTYLQSGNITDRDQLLIKWIDHFGEISICESCGKTTEFSYIEPDHSWFKDENISISLQEKLHFIYKNRHQGEHYYIEAIPYLNNPRFLHEEAYSSNTFPDEGFRLLTLYRFWNSIEYFFPSKYLIERNWDDVLREYIPELIMVKDELEYEQATVKLIGEIHDTHAGLWGGADKLHNYFGSNYPPFKMTYLKGQFVVSELFEDLNPTVRLGDAVTHINGEPVLSLISKKEELYPYSNNAAKMRDISRDLLRSNEEVLLITLNGNEDQEIKLVSQSDFYQNRNRETKCYKKLDDNIGYVTLENIKESDIAHIKSEFKDAKGIIIDIRNYPSAFVPFSLGSFFIKEETPFVKFSNFNPSNPGEFLLTPELIIQPDKKPFSGKVVVLVNEETQSQAEYTTMAFKAGMNTTVVGSTTAGADGNVSKIPLPGGMWTWISGLGVYYPDGTKTQRVGIIPDVFVEPTIEGLKEGKDEVLEKAVEIINLSK